MGKSIENMNKQELLQKAYKKLNKKPYFENIKCCLENADEEDLRLIIYRSNNSESGIRWICTSYFRYNTMSTEELRKAAINEARRKKFDYSYIVDIAIKADREDLTQFLKTDMDECCLNLWLYQD